MLVFSHHEVRLVQLCFDFYMIEAKPETLIGDRAYDSDPLDDDLRKDGNISARAAICSTVLSGQAPKPLSGAPKARGLTAKARIELSWMLPRSDTV